MKVYGLFQDMCIRHMFSIPETGDRTEMMRSVREAIRMEYDWNDPIEMQHAPLQVWGEKERNHEARS